MYENQLLNITTSLASASTVKNSDERPDSEQIFASEMDDLEAELYHSSMNR